MSIYIVDASVAAKWILSEPHKEAARRLRRPGYHLHAPDFLVLEMGNIVTTKIRRGDLDPASGSNVLALFHTSPVQLHQWTSLFHPAVQLANETRRSLYDCLYLALALLLEGDFVTADRTFYEGVQGHPAARHVCWIEDLPG